jgi:hypothetical protein
VKNAFDDSSPVVQVVCCGRIASRWVLQWRGVEDLVVLSF